ncbi:hypothetical protein GQ53DRAFT_839695 [Thozetella sp. PMI_491]|nr:hypothetical protein GQ53DRAFT_839695 [Thozetella sp. PMI_491]
MATGGANFQFICIQPPDGVKDRKAARLAKSHAVKRALANKRRAEEQAGHNFRVVPFRENPSRRVRTESRVSQPTSLLTPLSPAWLDPFNLLAADSSTLQAWVSHQKSSKAAGPVFSLADELVLQNYRSIFRTGLDDPALLNAAMLTFAFAMTGTVDHEFLAYHSRTLNHIRLTLGSPESAVSESTIGAILLLAGVEVCLLSVSLFPKIVKTQAYKTDFSVNQARLRMALKTQLHMNAIQNLLRLCQTQNIHLTDGIKRAIFWQDLNSSVLAGSSRIVNHTTFAEMHWIRDPFTPNSFILPPGFQHRSHLLTDELVEVLKDIHGLQCIRDAARFGCEEVLPMAQIDNQQASIQSRLSSWPDTSPFLDCCHLAAYLSSTMLRCKMWPDSVIPSHLSSQLLQKIQQSNDDPVWDDHPDVLVWLIHLGGASAPNGNIRSDYISLLRSNYTTRFLFLYGSWPELLQILKQFIWSDTAFLSSVKAFWKEAST